MCDPISLGLATAATVGGKYLSQNDALSNAQREADARNGVLSSAIGNLNGVYKKTNAPAFKGAVGAVNINDLAPAQAARTSAITSNLVAPDTGAPPAGGSPGASDAPPAIANFRNNSLKNAFDFATNQAKDYGTLGGYTDSWFNSNLAKQDAARKIGVGNAMANETKSLIGPEQDLAGAAAYRPPSMWGSVLQGAGSVLGSYAGAHVSPNGAQLPFGAGSYFAPTPSQILAPYSGGDW
jgi:hypothetical protein